MIRIIDARNRAAHAAALESMFEDRKRLFVDLLGWDVPVIRDRYEIDAFDGPDSLYVIALDEAGRHEGSLRLLPTTQPHILDSLFADLCAAGVPRDARTFEITRLCLPSRHGASRRLAIRNALIAAMVDHALAHGIARLTAVVEDRFRREVLAMGWLAEPLGPTVRIDGALLGAFAVHIAPNTPDRLRWTGIYPNPADHQTSAVA
jgi:N-acyl-L-homoserine lactone synthetase